MYIQVDASGQTQEAVWINVSKIIAIVETVPDERAYIKMQNGDIFHKDDLTATEIIALIEGD